MFDVAELDKQADGVRCLAERWNDSLIMSVNKNKTDDHRE